MKPIFTFILSYSEGFGLTVTLVGFSIVFLALTLLVIVFTRLPKILNVNLKRFLRKRSKSDATHEIGDDDYNIEGNVTAAISMALHLFLNDLHDEESNVITIKRVRRRYSPWSSKIYGVNQNWPVR